MGRTDSVAHDPSAPAGHLPAPCAGRKGRRVRDENQFLPAQRGEVAASYADGVMGHTDDVAHREIIHAVRPLTFIANEGRLFRIAHKSFDHRNSREGQSRGSRLEERHE